MLKEFDKYGDNVGHFTIVGDGPLMGELNSLANQNPKIKTVGRLGNEEVAKAMASHDYLILSSLYDGWGAVVNEALAVGTAVLCSEACGASILLDGGVRGESFSQANMTDTIKRRCNQGSLTSAQRKDIASWAATHLSGTVAARYFVETVRGSASTAPWLL